MKNFINIVFFFFFFIPSISIPSDCKIEQEKFCKEINHPKAKVTQCLLEHNDDLSETCKSYLKAFSEKNATASKGSM